LFNSLNLPLVECDILANRFCCQIITGSSRRFGKLFQALFGFSIDTNSKGILHLCAPVHELTQGITEAKESGQNSEALFFRQFNRRNKVKRIQKLYSPDFIRATLTKSDEATRLSIDLVSEFLCKASKMIMRNLIAFIRLSRPLFLLGGLLLYALGALIARYQGFAINVGLYWSGQLSVSALQLMTHYLNEYWDVETDRLNQNRTPFSGGSGVLVRGELPRQVAFIAAMVCLAIAMAIASWLIFTHAVPSNVWIILLLSFIGAYFYSSPPLTLSSTGYGELTTSIVVAGLVPALGHVLQTRQLSFLVLLVTAPLVILHLAMLLAFEFPDFLSDEATGKRTLLVRVGRRTGARLHTVLIFLAFSLVGVAARIGLPAQVALAIVTTSPLALLQISFVCRLQRGDPVSFTYLTFLGLLLFVLAASFTALSFWTIGI